MIKFPSINQFRETRRNVTWDWQFRGLDENQQPILDLDAVLPLMTFRGTPKIHGTNAGVVISNFGESVSFQSREREIMVENDNCGFAAFASKVPKSVWKSLCINGEDTVVFGEWAGQGVQGGVAVSQVPKFFAIFGIRPVNDEEGWQSLFAHPLDVTTLNEHRIFSIAQFGCEVREINFNNPQLDEINSLSLAVEEECPVAKFFGVSGVGEGRVWNGIGENHKSRYTFKVKGEKHSKGAGPKLANIDPEKVESVGAFVSKHVHEGRLTQAWNWLAEMQHPQELISVGRFIQWVVKDVMKEEQDEASFNVLDQKLLKSKITETAKKWFFSRVAQ